MKCYICQRDLRAKPKYYLDKGSDKFIGTYKNLGEVVFCFLCATKLAEKVKRKKAMKEVKEQDEEMWKVRRRVRRKERRKKRRESAKMHIKRMIWEEALGHEPNTCRRCGISLWGRDKYYWDEEYERYLNINVLRNEQGEFDENPYEERELYCEACSEGSELEDYGEDGILRGEDEIPNPE